MKRVVLLLSFLTATVHLQSQDHVRLVIRKSDRTLTVERGDSVLRSFRIAVGKIGGNKQRRGDYRTPEGSFAISQIQNATTWVHDFGDGKGPITGAYGPWFLRLKTPRWTGIGIHGTHDPASIGTMATEGCIRLTNEDVAALKEMVVIGTQVVIQP
jgi:lipoprotein-anchoring transpeptidase ErfK/SrfK